MNSPTTTRFGLVLGSVFSALAIMSACGPAHALSQEANALPGLIEDTQPKMVKIFGAGGLNRLEHYQSGFFVSGDGLILTVWSYVLDTENITVFGDDGTRFTAALVGFDPQLQLALLRVDKESLDYFAMDEPSSPAIGTRVLAFSNLYGVATGNERASVQQGRISAIAEFDSITRQGSPGRRTAYRGEIMILDAITSNPGSAGGAIVDMRGKLLGMIGKEQRSDVTGIWLNYGIPASVLAQSIQRIQSGESNWSNEDTSLPTEPMTVELLGIVLLPNVVARTPGFIDRVVPGSPAELAGLQEDDLIVEIDTYPINSRADVLEVLKRIDRDQRMTVLVQREKALLTIEIVTR